MTSELLNKKIGTSTADIELIQENLLLIRYHDIRGNISNDQVLENYIAANSICTSKQTSLIVYTAAKNELRV